MVTFMKTAQDYINALRRGDYFEAIKFSQYVAAKYAAIAETTYLENDLLLPLCIYELSQTDLQARDIDAICFINNYFAHLYETNNKDAGAAELDFNSLASAAGFALAARASIPKVEIKTKKDITQLLGPQSEFTKAQESSRAGAESFQGQIFQSWGDERTQKIADRIGTLDSENYQKLRQGVAQIASTRVMKNYGCPILEAVHLKRIVKEYKAHLLNRMKRENIPATPLSALSSADTEPASPQVGNSRAQKLLNRYQAICTLEKQIANKNIVDAEVKGFVKTAYKTCNENRASWSERPFLDKFLDVISLGIRAALRNRFSKERQYSADLDEMAPESSPPTPGH